ncbi:hypothetical protein [Flavobacterium sp. 3HN19-14]|uniref:hypothetical protein n=1 Tax=Flavobacterium sp. 3HN19-14 TaxID=3448133 RepID=UPI003EE378E0
MVLLYKSSINFKLKALMLMLLVGCCTIKTSGQDFKWLYTIPSVKVVVNSSSYIYNLATNDNNEIYALGGHYGEHDFGDGQQEMIHHGNPDGANNFIIKLDADKNVLWVRHFDFATHLYFGSITLDDNGDVFISGTVETRTSSVYLNPNPTNPGIPNAYTPTHQNLLPQHYYGFIIKLDAQGNYSNSILFPDIALSSLNGNIMGEMTKDHDNNLITTGASLLDYFNPVPEWAM